MGRIRSAFVRATGLMLVAVAAWAAEPRTPPAPPETKPRVAPRASAWYDNVRFTRHGVEDGLSQASVRAMLQDAAGYVWLGTQDGLNRFDGYEFRIHRHDRRRSDSLPDNHIRALEPSRRGGFWVGTQTGGLARRLPDRDGFERYPADGRPGSLADSTVLALHETADGTLWVSSGTDSLQWLPPGASRFNPVDAGVAARVGQVHAMASLDAGRLLLGSNTGLWLLGPDGTLIGAWTDASAMRPIDDIAVSPEGDVWAGGQAGGLMRFDRHGRLLGELTSADGLTDGRVLDLQFDGRGRLWVGTLHGLSRLEAPDHAPAATPRVWHHGAGLDGAMPSSAIHTLMLDRDGLLWAGSWLNGVSVHVPQSEAFSELRVGAAGSAVPAAGVYALWVDPDGSLWLAASDGVGLLHYDIRQGRMTQYAHRPGDPASLPVWEPSDVLRDRRGVLWVTTDNGLARLEGDRFLTERHVPGELGSLPANELHNLYEDRSGTLWVSTRDGLLASRCAGCTGFRTYRLDGGGRRIEVMLEDSAGNFWLGGGGTGLHRLDRDSGQLETIRSGSGGVGGLSHDSLTALLEDSQGRLWIGTQGGGVNRLVPRADGTPAFIVHGVAEGLAAPAVGGLVEDDKGMIWISTNVGISRLDPRTGRISNYGAASGAQLMGYLVGSHSRLPDGRIAMGGMQGVTVFDPEGLQPLPSPRRVALTGVGVPGARSAGRAPVVRTEADGIAEIVLPAGANDLGLKLSSLSYAAPGRVRFAYRLEGVNDDWVEVDAGLRQASYNNLPPGSYTFHARARMPDGDWSEELQVPVRLEPQWWQTGAARAAYLLAALLVVGGISWEVRSRSAERARSQRELARINVELESRVEQRTAALHATNASLHHTIDELRRTQQQLVEAEKMASLGGLVAGVAHEINTPIGVAVTAASWLEEEARRLRVKAGEADSTVAERLRAVAMESAGVILRNLQRADRLIRSFKQVAVDQSIEQPRRLQLAQYLEEVMATLQPSLRRYTVEIDCPPDIVLHTYPGAIYQVVANLAINSVTHGFVDGRPGHIGLSVRQEGDEVVLRYRDDGVGMDEKARRRVFEPFYTTRRGEGGSGLGMHITWNLVTQLLGGSIACDSTPGEGTRFTVRIPLRAPVVAGKPKES